MSKKEKINFTDAELHLMKLLEESRQKAQKRFPLVSALAATFGLVLVLNGFQRLITKIPFLDNNPIIIIVTGLVVLTITGSVYKKLN